MAYFCSQCGTQLADGTKFCPNCGASTNQVDAPKTNYRGTEYSKTNFSTPEPKRKKSVIGQFFKVIAIILCVIVALFCIILIISIGKSDDVESKPILTQEQGAVQSEDLDNESVAQTSDSNEKTIGDTTVVDGFECQIKEVNWYSSSDFDYDIIEKEDGYEYIVIVLSEKNTTDSTENAPMFSILSADGQQCTNKAGLSLYKNQYKINFGATMAGATAEAYVVYQIPSGAEEFKLQIMSNGFGSNSDYIFFERDDIQ